MPRSELVAFGAAVRAHRGRLGISQEALAERSELHRTYVGGVERGERNVGLVNVYRLAEALDILAPELFETAETFRRGVRRTSPSRR